MFINKVKSIGFFKSLLAEQGEHDCGFRKLMQDFVSFMSKAIIEQFHNGKISPENMGLHKMVLQRLTDYVLRRFHSTLFRT